MDKRFLIAQKISNICTQTASKISIQKTAEATDGLLLNTIADRISKAASQTVKIKSKTPTKIIHKISHQDAYQNRNTYQQKSDRKLDSNYN